MYDPIAIIGFSFKFPGDADSVEGFWDTVVQGRRASSAFPSDRLDLSGISHPDVTRNGTTTVQGGNFLRQDVAAFDAPFFSISSTEAATMDPQQRLLLETTYHALESAGIPMHKVSDSLTSVFTGSFTDDYKTLYTKDIDFAGAYAATGICTTLNSNRISWFFNLLGNSVTIDSACSSSLVALDLACKSLHSHDSNMSIVTGVNLMLAADMFYVLSDMNMLSPNGRCSSFDESSNGYGRGEGLGVLIIKRLSDAIKDGDTIRAVIRSTGSNSDGRTPGITQPRQSSQEVLIQDCYRKAGLDPDHTGYFESHGTGTPIGDPIEANAIEAVFGQRNNPQPLYIGAVKSNIGHLEGASGIVGIIKSILVLERGMIPPIAGLTRLNPRINQNSLNIKFPKQLLPWPSSGLRRASVNSFGYGGTNSHVILDDALHYLQEHHLNGIHCTTLEPSRVGDCFDMALPTHTRELCTKKLSTSSPFKTLVFSAADQRAISQMSLDYSKHIGKVKLKLSNLQFRSYLENLAFTLAIRRSELPWRACVTVDVNKFDIQNFVRSFTKPVRTNSKPKVAMIFSGQGAQWATMGKELMVYDSFLSSLKDAETVLQSFGCVWKLTDEILRVHEASRIHDAEFSQPICTALQLALIDLLRVCGVSPDAVIGHSSGEIAAAYCIGAISAQAALKIAYTRGICASKLQSGHGTKGGMMSVGLSAVQARSYLKDKEKPFGSLVIACYNGPSNVTISGPAPLIDKLKLNLDHDDVFARKLPINVAYHSPCMAKVAQQYTDLMASLDFGAIEPTRAFMISTVSGNLVKPNELRQASYWVKNLVSPVLFTKAFERLGNKNMATKLDGSHRSDISVDICIEVGPHAALRHQIRDLLDNGSNQSIHYLSVLERKQNDAITYLSILGRLHCYGYPVNWMEANHTRLGYNELVPLCDLPEYAFDHSKHYFHESKISKAVRIQSQPKLDLLGKRVADWNQYEARWHHFLRLAESPWIEHHKINGLILLPAASMLVMAIEALKQLAVAPASIRGFELCNVNIHTPVIVPPDGVQIEVHVSQDRDACVQDMKWRVFTLRGEQWIECCHGIGRIDYKAELSETNNTIEEEELLHRYQLQHSKDRQSHLTAADTCQLYSHLAKCGYEFGTDFQSILNPRFSSKGASADVACYRWTDDGGINHRQDHVVHPCTLDGLIQLPMVSLTQGGTIGKRTSVPTSIRRLWVSVDGLDWPYSKSLEAVARVVHEDYRGIETKSSALIKDGSEIGAILEGVHLTFIPGENDNSVEYNALWEMQWKPDIDLLSGPALQDLCIIVRDESTEPVDFYNKLTFLLYTFLHKTTGQLTAMGGIKMQPHFVKYLSWAEMQMLKHHSTQAPGQLSSTYEHMVLDEAYIQSLLFELSDKNAQAKVYLTIGQNLLEILCGRMSVLDLLFQNNLAYDWYEESTTHKAFDSFNRYLDVFSHKYPSARYLEVGGGTGGSTLAILQSLLRHQDPHSATHSMYHDYTFTDISESFFEKAKERFKEYPKMSYKRFDIEKSPSAQGFEALAYDCIIAANVVHATTSLAHTLKNLHGLLRPGGKLILIEVTNPTILRAGFLTGLLPGWWLSSEDYRSQGYGPCLETDIWHKVLLENGFSGADVVLQDFESKECREVSFLITTKITTPTTIPNSVNISIVTAVANPVSTDVCLWTEALAASDMPTPHIIPLLEFSGSTTTSGDICLFVDDPDRPILRYMGEPELEMLKRMLASYSTIVWVTQRAEKVKSPDMALVDGLLRTLRQEYDNTKFVAVSLIRSDTSCEAIKWRQIATIALQVFNRNVNSFEPEFEERDGQLYICRLTSSREASQRVQELAKGTLHRDVTWSHSQALELAVETTKKPRSLVFVEDEEHSKPLGADEVEIQVNAASISFQDCLIALDQVNGGRFGNDCTGTVTRVGAHVCSLQEGERVCMSAPDGALKTYARSKAHSVQRLPGGVSFVQGATILTPFITAWTCLIEIARLEKGESILVHAANDDAGQAAVQIARYIGATVFATVDSPVKKRLVIKRFGLEEQHVLYSNNTSLTLGIQRLTRGRGVDVVLRSLTEPSLTQPWNCLASCGRFVEIGKRDMVQNASLPMLPYDKSTTFSTFDASVWRAEKPDKLGRIGKNIIDLFAQGVFRTATPLHSHSISEVEDVFKSLTDSKISGQIVVEMTANAVVPANLKVKSNYRLRSDKTYVIAGGLGGLGRSIAKWMVQHGAMHLILLSRSGMKNVTAKSFVEELEAEGARVKAPQVDISDKATLTIALQDCLSIMPAIGGCVHASMVLRDILFKNMSMDHWQAVTKSKVQGSWNLHELLPREMDFFICLSSISGVYGLRAQSNYAAGNTYLDALARYRVSHGEKAVSISLGPVESDGYLAENKAILERLLQTGFMRAVTRHEIHGLLAYYCNPNLPVLALQDAQVVIGVQTPEQSHALGQDLPECMREPVNRIMVQSARVRSNNTDDEVLKRCLVEDMRADFVRVKQNAEAAVVATRMLAAKLARSLALAHEDEFDLDKPIHSFGVDSLGAIELQRWIKRELQANITIIEITGGVDLRAIGALIADRSKLRIRRPRDLEMHEDSLPTSVASVTHEGILSQRAITVNQDVDCNRQKTTIQGMQRSRSSLDNVHGEAIHPGKRRKIF